MPQCFLCTDIVLCLTSAFVTEGKNILCTAHKRDQHPNWCSEPYGYLSYLYTNHRFIIIAQDAALAAQDYSSTWVVTLLQHWACGIASTSFHFLALSYLPSFSFDHFRSQFCLLSTARNVSLSLKVLRCLCGVPQAVSKCFRFGSKGRNPMWHFLVNSRAPSQQLTQYLHFQAVKMSHLPWFQECFLIVQVVSPDLIKTTTLLKICTL